MHALKGSLGSRHSATPDVSFKCAHVQCELFRRNNYWDHSIVVDQKSQWSIRMISFRRVFFQVAAAKVTAEAAQAATAGEINAAAYAVLEAARSIELTLSKQRSQQKMIQSKTCNIL